jgi:hypothetical protein
VSRQALGPTQPPIQWVPGALSSEVKRLEREADHSPPASFEVKEMWIYTSFTDIEHKNLIHIECDKYRPLLINISGIIALRITEVSCEFPQSFQAIAVVLLHIRPRSYSSPYFSIRYSLINLSFETMCLAIAVAKYTIN